MVKAKDLLIDKILLCFASGSAYRTFQNDSFYGDYGKDTFYRFDQIPTANWERLESSVALNVIQDQYSHIIDENRKDNAKLFENAFYQGLGIEVADNKINASNGSEFTADPKVIDQLLKNPELVNLPMQLTKVTK